MPSTAFATASSDDEPARRRRRRRSSSPKATRETSAAWTAATSANAIAVAGEQVELRERHRHQPLERPGRPLAQHRDRRDEEHRDEREERRAAAPPMRSKTSGAARRTRYLSSVTRARTGTTSEQRDRPRVAAELRAARATRSRQVAARGSSAAPASIEAQERAVEVLRAGPRAQLVRASPAASRRPSRRSSERVAAVGLVHHVARDEQRRARRPRARGTVCQRSRRSTGSRPDGRLVEHEQLGPAEQRRRERDARALAAGEPVDDAVRARRSRSTRVDHLVDPLRAARRGRARSSAGSPARSGRRRPTAPGSRSRRGARSAGEPAGAPSTRDRAALDDLHADDRRGSASTCRSRSARAAR